MSKSTGTSSKGTTNSIAMDTVNSSTPSTKKISPKTTNMAFVPGILPINLTTKCAKVPVGQSAPTQSSSKTQKRNSKGISKTQRVARREAAILKQLYAPKDTRVNLISAGVMNLLTKGTQPSGSRTLKINPPVNLETKPSLILDQDFPSVHSLSKNEVPILEPGPLDTASATVTEPHPPTTGTTKGQRKKNSMPSKKPFLVNLEELLQTTSSRTKTKSSRKKSSWNEIILSKAAPTGNLLDSSRPAVIHRGKIRSRPSKKRLTKLKAAILLARSIRQQSKSQGNDPLLGTITSSDTNLNTVSSIHENAEVIELQSESRSFSSEITYDPAILRGIETLQIEIPPEAECDEVLPLCDNSDKVIDSCCQNQLTEGAVEATQQVKYFSEGHALAHDDYKEKDYGAVFRQLLEEALIPEKVLLEEKVVEPPDVVIPSPIICRAKEKLHKKGKKWRTYCDMYVTKELHLEVIALLQELHRFQDRLYHTDPIKFQNNRRYVHGIKEVSAMLDREKVQVLIIAPDLELADVKGGLDEKIDNVLKTAKAQAVPYLFSGNRFVLGKSIRIKSPVSIIGILNKQGTEELVGKLLTTVAGLRDVYTSDLRNIVNELTKQP